MEKEKEEKRRKERKNRDAFKDILKAHVKDGTITAKLRWKVSFSQLHLGDCHCNRATDGTTHETLEAFADPTSMCNRPDFTPSSGRVVWAGCL